MISYIFASLCEYDALKLQYESLKEGHKNSRRVIVWPGRVFLQPSPTGSGKSLCFEMASYAIVWVRFGPLEEENIVRTVCIILAPLLFLMHDQVASLKRKVSQQNAICIGPEFSQEDIN